MKRIWILSVYFAVVVALMTFFAAVTGWLLYLDHLRSTHPFLAFLVFFLPLSLIGAGLAMHKSEEQK